MSSAEGKWLDFQKERSNANIICILACEEPGHSMLDEVQSITSIATGQAQHPCRLRPFSARQH